MAMLTPSEARLLDVMVVGGVSSAIPSSSSIRRARAQGASGEFHEYRHYQPGDDPRSIDWTVEARLRQLFVRVSRAEGHLALHVLVDSSGPMRLGTPPKIDCASKIAAALCYTAIQGRDSAAFASFDQNLHLPVRARTGRAQLSRIFEALDNLQPSGPSALDAALERYASIARGPGIAVILSDFFDPAYRGSGVQALMYRGLTPALLQIVSREEIDPAIADAVTLLDVEDDGGTPLVVDRDATSRYRERVRRHSEDLRQACLAHSLPWARITSDASFEEILVTLERAGVLGLS
jgi:uncharacterized protein (DUF58 family)